MRHQHAATAAVLCATFMAPAARAQFAYEPEAPKTQAASKAVGGTPSADTGGTPYAGSGWIFGGALDVHAQSELSQAGTSPASPPASVLQPEVGLPSRRGVRSNTFVDADLSLYANYDTWLSFNGDIKLERTRWANLDTYYAGANNFLNHEAVTLRQAYVTLRPTPDFSVYAGKIHPAFGSAYELTPGNFYSFATDYEQDERIGFGVQYKLPDVGLLNNVRLSAEIFYLDTSFLSNTLLSRPSLDDPITDRAQRYTRGAFAPSNTGALNSFTLALRGGNGGNGISYQVSYTSQATSDPDGSTSHGISASFRYADIPVGRSFKLTPFGEYAWFDNCNNIPDLTRQYMLGGVALARGKWELDVAGGARLSHGYASETSHQQNVSLNYALSGALTVGGGVNRITINGRESWTFGPSLTYSLGL